ncbi:MAG: phosphotransferase [Bacteroidales bacterium]|nr:phosphotransferase [Bacteroidales bacterium]
MEQLFELWAGEPCKNKIQLTANGSNRLYYRLEGDTHSCIAAKNHNVRENEAFFSFAAQMRQRGVNVPEVYAVSDDRTTYLQQDLGNVTLYTYLTSRKTNGVDVSEPMRELYKRVIDQLIAMQTSCDDVDFGLAYPRSTFDAQAIQWDLNYFKYYFLRLFHIPFDEQLLEDDFRVFTDFLLEGDCGHFVHRDFQSRNIMLFDEKIYFIDFQGARRGAAQYDLASLLYSSKSDIPEDMRLELLEYYIRQRQQTDPSGHFDPVAFRDKFYGYVLVRMMQAMGAYGYRGVIEKKDYFVKSIPYAVRNLRRIIDTVVLPVDLPHLGGVWRAITEMADYADSDNGLLVSVFSFSYRSGIPYDKSGNGGGYVFDCRALPNPGLYDEYRLLNGRDKAVIDFFEQHPETEQYLSSVRAIVAQSVKSYIEKGYTRLMINFGCTGGRHRSVYCAEQIARYIQDNFDCRVTLHHLEQSKLTKVES